MPGSWQRDFLQEKKNVCFSRVACTCFHVSF